ncbi:MAG: hypothetical protein R3286_06350 [Gammaproteobacteria bacterium]|nr:hypothetical protein [Gammaproteobacteria bacterium]
MSRTVALREIAHARAGDKGNCSNVCVFVYDPAHYAAVAAQLTGARLEQDLGALLRGSITRYELPEHNGFNFVMSNALEGGVNESLNLDGHGKSWSSLILGLDVELEDPG